MVKLILGTTSPHRKKAFLFLGLDYECRGSDVDEYFEGRPDNPEELVRHLAKLKANAVAAHYSEGQEFFCRCKTRDGPNCHGYC